MYIVLSKCKFGSVHTLFFFFFKLTGNLTPNIKVSLENLKKKEKRRKWVDPSWTKTVSMLPSHYPTMIKNFLIIL